VSFEVFERPGRSPDEPVLSVRSSGNLRLNPAARRLLGAAVRVELLFDRERRVAGVRPSQRPEGSPVVFRLRTTRDHGGATIHAQAFVDHYGLRPDEVRHLPVSRESDGTVVAEIVG
jgi:hypothetical protein